MSELQIGLLSIGLMVVVLVLVYNKWQEVRYRRNTEQAFGNLHQDVLMSPAAEASQPGQVGPVEPRFSPEAAQQSHLSKIASETPLASGSVQESGVMVPVSAGLDRIHPLSDEIDFIVTLRANSNLNCADVKEQLQPLLAGFGESLACEALGPDSETWHTIASLDATKAVRIGLQLVSRRGPVESADLDRVCNALQAIAPSLGAVLSVAPQNPMDVARNLDQFCAEVDIQIAINVEAQGEPFSGSQIAAFAEARGFELDDGGRYRCLDAAGRDICTMQNGERAAFVEASLRSLVTPSVTFELDVPRCNGTRDAFDDCLAIARGFAAQFGGRLVDDNGMDIGNAGLNSIRSQLEPIFAAMHARGIPAGSPLALRLFT